MFFLMLLILSCTLYRVSAYLDKDCLVVRDDALRGLPAGQGSTIIAHILIRMSVNYPAQVSSIALNKSVYL